MFINCERSERKAKINGCRDSCCSFLKNGSNNVCKKSARSSCFTYDCIWFVWWESGYIDQFISIILWQVVLMARIICVEITPASLTRLKLLRSKESNNVHGFQSDQSQERRWRKLSSLKTSNPVAQEQPESCLNHTLYLCSIEILPYKYICWVFQYLLNMWSLKGKK